MTPRAPALPPQERRAQLIDATLEVLLERGRDATTREIAERAGVAEGTLFRVFDTKDDLLTAALRQAFDPADLIAGLEALDTAPPLSERVENAVALIQAHYRRVFELVDSVGMLHPPERTDDERDATARRRIRDALAALLGPDAGALRVPAEEAVHVLLLLTFSASHPRISDGWVLSPAQITSHLLGGVLDATPATEGSPA